MFEKIDRLLNKKKLNRQGLLLSTQMCFEVAEQIKKIIPESQGEVKIISYKDNIIRVASNNTVILHKIKMSQEKIKQNINKRMKTNNLKFSYSPRND